MKKPAPVNHTINDHIRNRWSPRAYAETPVDTGKIHSVLEAARWASSAFNEQPWRFIIGVNYDQTHQKITETLVEWNQKWASKAPVLILNIAKRTFSHNSTKNVTHKYDLGQAVANMAIEAVNQGLISHQMSGFDPEKARQLFNIPGDFQAVSVIALGHYGNPDLLPDDMQLAESKPRERKSLNELVFTDSFGKSTSF